MRNKQRISELAVLLFCLTTLVHSASAHDFDLVENSIGDSRLATFCGYSFARPISIEFLSVTNESGQILSYSIGARIVYKDLRFPHPSKAPWTLQQMTGDLLNEWLTEYVQEECAGADLDVICESYLKCVVARNLQEGFPEYVKERIAELPDPSLLKIDAVTIDEIQSEGAFHDELIRRSLNVSD